MSLRCAVIFCLFLAANSASIAPKNIPVEIVYEDSAPLHFANRNLEEKIQISHDDLLKMRLADEIINEGTGEEARVQEVPGVRNLDPKIQLSPEELGQVVKHLPLAENEVVKTELIAEQEPAPAPLASLLKKAEMVVFSGINSIRNNIDSAAETVAAARPTQEAWEKLNQTLETFFLDQYKSVNLKQDKPPENNNQNNQNNEFLQNIINGFQSISNQFMNNYFPQNQSSTGSEDEQSGQQGPQNAFQNLVNFFQGGINQVVNNMNNLNSPNATSEDTGTENTNLIGNIVNQFQQFFNNPSPALTNNQSDTGVQPPNSGGGFFQGAVNQFNQVVSNFRPTTSTLPPQGDEGVVSSTQPPNIFQNIGQALQNVNVFGQQSSTQPPAGAGGSNFISAGAEAIGSQIGQVTGGQGGGVPPIPGAGAIGSQFGQVIGGQGGTPPIPGAEAIGSQFGQVIGGQGGAPPIPGAEAIGSQFGQVIGGQGGLPGNPIEGLQNAIGGATSSTEKGKSGAELEKEKDSSPAIGEAQNEELTKSK